MGRLREHATALGLAAALSCTPFLVIVSLYAALLFSLEVPRRFVDSGVQDFEGVKREQARRFLQLTGLTLNEGGVVPSGALRVESVKKCPPGRVRLPYSVEVQVYGPFGMPTSPIKWHCDGTATQGGSYVVEG